MNQDYSKEISFTNSYFALADGLVLGLENFLSKNVILDWFGKTITGRTNVATFMNTHKVNSRHVFTDIIPTNNIGYNKSIYQSRRQKFVSIKNPSNFESISVNEITSSGDRSWSLSKINVEGNNLNESELAYELYNDEPSNLFKLEKIKLTNVKEIEQHINQINLDDKLYLKSQRKRKCKEVDKLKNIDKLESSIKYVEAQGEILFSKRSHKHSGWRDCKIISSSSTHTWRKPCKLQIAYSSQQICFQKILSSNNNSIKFGSSSNFVGSQNKVLNYDSITELNNHFTSNVNNLTQYLENNNLIREDIFLQNLKECLSKNEANKLELIPQYIDGQLVFQKTLCDDNYDFQNSFIFNHLIHVIIYEGKSRCRMNLSQKF